MGRKDPVLEELFFIVRKDLEDVIQSEVEKVRDYFGCKDAKVFEDVEYLEFTVDYGTLADLPTTHVFYVRRSKVREFRLDIVVLRDSSIYTIARVYVWFIDGRDVCYSDVNIYTQRVNDLAEAIVTDMMVEVESNEREN